MQFIILTLLKCIIKVTLNAIKKERKEGKGNPELEITKTLDL